MRKTLSVAHLVKSFVLLLQCEDFVFICLVFVANQPLHFFIIIYDVVIRLVIIVKSLNFLKIFLTKLSSFILIRQNFIAFETIFILKGVSSLQLQSF